MTLAELAGRFTGALRTRAAFGLQPVAAPAMVFIPLGMLLGPRMLGLLSENALDYLDVVVSVALATLGVFIGLALGREGRPARVLFAAASVEACITIVIVGGAVLVLLRAWQHPARFSIRSGCRRPGDLRVGICRAGDRRRRRAQRADGGTGRRPRRRAADPDGRDRRAGRGGAGRLLRGVALTILLGVAVGMAGWLLIERAEGEAERGVFVLGLLALPGGAAAYLGFSPLLTGLAAGWSWVVAPGQARSADGGATSARCSIRWS